MNGDEFNKLRISNNEREFIEQEYQDSGLSRATSLPSFECQCQDDIEDSSPWDVDTSNPCMENKKKIPMKKLAAPFVPKSSVYCMYPQEEQEVIDSALLSALQDPKERIGLLRLEQVLLEFMNSPAKYIDVGGPSNSCVLYPSLDKEDQGGIRGRQTSFQKLCLHRLADRFGIAREHFPGTNLIRLVKTKGSCISNQLLINLVETNPKSTQKKQVTQPPKIKRREDSSSSLKILSTKKKQPLKKKLSEKEKAYAEARARIYNNTKEAPPSPPSSIEDNQEEFSKSKVTWRNRREEENDPDFRRNELRPATIAPPPYFSQPFYPQLAPPQDPYNYYYQGAPAPQFYYPGPQQPNPQQRQIYSQGNQDSKQVVFSEQDFPILKR